MKTTSARIIFSFLLCLLSYEGFAQSTVKFTNVHDLSRTAYGLRYNTDTLGPYGSSTESRYGVASSYNVINPRDTGSFYFTIDSLTKNHTLYGFSLNNYLFCDDIGGTYPDGQPGIFTSLVYYVDFHDGRADIYNMENLVDSASVSSGDQIKIAKVYNDYSDPSSGGAFKFYKNGSSIGSISFDDYCCGSSGFTFNIGVVVETVGGGIDSVQCNFGTTDFGTLNYSVVWDRSNLISADIDTLTIEKDTVIFGGLGGGISANKLQDTLDGYVQYMAIEPDLATESFIAFGLLSFEDDADLGNVNYFAISDNIYEIYDNGSYIGTFGSAQPGDILTIYRIGGYFKWMLNGDSLYTSSYSGYYSPLGDGDYGLNAFAEFAGYGSLFDLTASFPSPLDTPVISSAISGYCPGYGEPFTMSVNNPLWPHYRWFKNGSAIANSDSASHYEISPPSASATYQAMVYDDLGDTLLSNTLPITVSPIAIISHVTNVSPCRGDNNGIDSLFVSGGSNNAPWGGNYRYSLGDDPLYLENPPVLPDIAAGIYTITVTDYNGCTATKTDTITQPDTLTVSITSSTNVSCYGGSNGTIKAIISGEDSLYTYIWSPEGGLGYTDSANASGLTADTYTVIAFATYCTGTATATVTITQPTTALSAAITSSTNVLCYAANTGAAIAGASGGTTPYTYSWSPSGGTTSSVSGISAGTYTVTITDAHSCSATATTTITQPSSALSASITSSTNVSCYGGSNGAGIVSVSGGTTGYTYSWSPSGGTTSSASGLTAGTYTVTVTDAHSCTATSTTILTQPSSNPTWYRDYDGDGYGNLSNDTVACTQPSGYVSDHTDCNDSDATVHSLQTYYRDADDDGYTDPNVDTLICSVNTIYDEIVGNWRTIYTLPNGSIGDSVLLPDLFVTRYAHYTVTNGAIVGYETAPRMAGDHLWDCNDTCQSCAAFAYRQPGFIHPGAQELCNGIDDNCNGYIDDSTHDGLTYRTYYMDADGDAFGNPAGPTLYSCQTAAQIITGDTAVWALDNTDCNDDPDEDGLLIHVAPTVSISGSVALCSGSSGGLHPYVHHSTIYAPWDEDDSLVYNHFSADSAAAHGYTPYSWITYAWSTSGTTEDISVSSAGTYSVTVSQFGCTGSASVNVSVNSLPTANAGPDQYVCNGDSISLGGSPTASGGTSPYTYSWSGYFGGPLDLSSYTVANPRAKPLPGGSPPPYDYYVDVTDANGCMAEDTMTITIYPPPTVTISSSTNVSCYGASTGAATASASGGTTAYTYSWSPSGGTTSSTSGLSAGTYTVMVTDGHGCTASATATITQPPLSGSSCANATAYTIGVNPDTVYTMTCTSYWLSFAGNGETATQLIVQTSDTAHPLNIQTISLYSGSCGSPTLVWDSTITGSNQRILFTLYNLDSTLTYSLNFTQASSDTSYFRIESPLHSACIEDGHGNPICSDTICSGATIQVVTDSNYILTTYVWTLTSDLGDTIIFTSGTTSTTYTLIAPPGTYCLNVGDASDPYVGEGCPGPSYTPCCVTVVDSASIAPPDFTLNPNPLCDDDPIDGTATILNYDLYYIYQWSTPGSTCLTFYNNGGGNYGYAHTCGNGTYDVCLTVNHLGCDNPNTTCHNLVIVPPSVQITDTIVSCLCVNYSAIVSCDSALDSYTWSFPGGSPNYSGSQSSNIVCYASAGTYSATLIFSTVNGSYIDTSTITVTVGTPPTVTITSDSVSCYGGGNGSATAHVTGGKPSYTYSWSNFDLDSTATPLSAGTYTVTVSDSLGCSVTDTVTIKQPDSLSITTSASSDCGGANNGSAKVVSVTGGTPGYHYTWSNAATTSSITGLVSGTYTVTVTDSKGCTKTATVTVTAHSPPVVTISPSDTTLKCPGTVVLTASGALTYIWSNGATTSSTIVLPSAGTTTYTVTGTDINGCTASTIDTITAPPQLNVIDHYSPLHCGTYCDTVSLSGGTPPYKYIIFQGDTFPYTGSNTFCHLLPDSTYLAIGVDSNGCLISVSITNYQLQPGPLVVNCSLIQNESCSPGNDGEVSVAVSGGYPVYTYTWSPNVSNTYIATGLTAGTYTVTVTDTTGCTATCSVTVALVGSLDITATPPSAAFCSSYIDSSIILNVSGATTYSWSTGATTASVVVNPTSTTTYTVTGTNTNGCSGSATITVTLDSTCCSDSGFVEIADSSGYIPAGTYMGNYTLNATRSIYSGTTVVFLNMNLLINDDVSIIVESGATLKIGDCGFTNHQHLYACHDMWRGINVMGDGILDIECNTLIEDAQYAVQAQDRSNVTALATTFNKDYVGIYVQQNPYGNTVNAIISLCNFTCTPDLISKYAGQTPDPLTHTFAGIYINDLSILTLPGTNSFDKLNHGIYSINSNLVVNGGSFTNIQVFDAYGLPGYTLFPPDPYGVVEHGAGIYARGVGARSLTFTGNGSSTNFDNCGFGIYAERINATVHKAIITNLIAVGIYTVYGTGFSTDISNNSISTGTSGSINEQDGIYLYLNTSPASTRVNDNYINMQNPNVNGSYGIRVFAYPGASIGPPSISGNDVYMANAKGRAFGIVLSSTEQYAAFNNFVYFNKATTHLPVAAYGIAVSGSPSTMLSCNHILGQTLANRRNVGRYGIYTYAGIGYYYKCNYTDSTFDGIFYRDGLSLGNLSSNDINHHENGLHVNANGIMGYQSWEGNRWIAPQASYTWPATNQGPYKLSLFKINNFNSTIYFPAVSPGPDLWFTPSSGADSSCGSILSPYCPPTLVTTTGNAHGFGVVLYKRLLDPLDSLIARDSVHTVNFDTQISWSAKRMLMEELLVNDSLIAQDGAVTAFYTAHINDNIGALSKIRLALDTLLTIDSSTVAEIQSNLEVISANAINMAVNDSTIANDTTLSSDEIMELETENLEYSGYINTGSHQNDSIYSLINASVNVNAIAIKNENNTLSSSAIYEQNEIAVNNIYLSTIAINHPDSLVGYSTQLYSIARQCALSGGEAVSLARSLYAAINDSIFFDDDQICGSPNDTCLVPSMPNPIAGRAAGVCGLHLNYTIDSVAGATGYTWSIIGNAVIDSGQGSISVWVTFTDSFATGTISVYATDSCGSGNAATIAITGYPVPPAAISGSSEICNFAFDVPFSIDSVEGATSYTWVVPSGCTIDSGQGTQRIVVDWDSVPGNVTVVASNGCGTSDSTSHTVNVVGCRLAKTNQAIQVNTASGNVKMYPNPTTGHVTVIYHLTSSTGILQLYDVVGKLVGSYQLSGNRNQFEFDMGDLCCGIFGYRILDNGSLTSEGKLVIVK